MNRALLGGCAAVALIAAAPALAAGPAITYVPDSLAQSKIHHGPWTLHESAEKEESAREERDEAEDHNESDGNPHDASGIVPSSTLTPPYSGFGTPYASLCGASGKFNRNHRLSLMQPYYFPFVRRRDDVLEGFFDYRPRNQQEATVMATSEDWGRTWTFRGEALALNPYCPFDATDPDNLNVNVNGAKVPYGSSSDNAADNGLGHPVVLSFGHGVERIYHLNRANGHIDSDPLVVHTLPPSGSLAGLPEFGYVSPLASGGYPTLTGAPVATSGLINPDAIMGSVTRGSVTTVVYVEKTLNGDLNPPFTAAQRCPKTPAFALTNLVNGKPRKANDDVTAVRVATTTDGITFTDVGIAAGLSDPTTVALNGIRWVGSGSILPLEDGRYGMFFGAGNCLDNDSDAFHILGYAETDARVSQPSDLLHWHIVYGFDNPILSTDAVTDPAGPRTYPLNSPLVNVAGADALTAAQVAPFVPPSGPNPPPGGYTSNFFSGRVYDPQAIYTDRRTVTIVFAGYNTPQPSNNLGDYRTIGRFQVRFPEGYVERF
jgi:hypothetical protein